MASQMAETGAGGLDAAGPEDAPTVVFLHGAVFTRKEWVPQRESLKDAFRVLAPDLPGHGERAARDFRMEPALDAVDDVVRGEANGPVTLVGLSLGGYVATAYASQHPDAVDGLVVSGSSANPVDKLETVTCAVAGLSRLATRSERVRNKVRALAASWVEKRDLPPEQTAEIVRAGFYPRQFGEAGPQLAGQDFRAMFASYPGPTLVLNGEADKLMRQGEDGHVAAARNARAEVVGNAGHACNLGNPTQYTDAVRRFYRQSVAPTAGRE